MSEETTQAQNPAPAAEEKTVKSIVDSKYRDKYKNRSEWLADLLKNKASLSHSVAGKAAVGEEGKEGYKAAVPERVVVDGVDVDALFAIARENGLNVDKYDAQRGGHGFSGRFRMTVGNMLRAIAKQRHGITVKGEWEEAPTEWLTAVQAPTEATHNKDGSKIAKAAPPATPPESKLIKAADVKPSASTASTTAPMSEAQKKALHDNTNKNKGGKKR